MLGPDYDLIFLVPGDQPVGNAVGYPAQVIKFSLGYGVCGFSLLRVGALVRLVLVQSAKFL